MKWIWSRVLGALYMAKPLASFLARLQLLSHVVPLMFAALVFDSISLLLRLRIVRPIKY